MGHLSQLRPVELDIQGDVATLRLNRPAVHNAVDEAVMATLQEELDGLSRQPEIRFLILTGAGERSFCAGGDLKYFATLETREQGERAARRMSSLLDRLAAGPQVVLAAVNGSALGGGCEILTACHFRVAAAAASFSFRQAANGLTTGWGGGLRLFELLGRAQALRLLLSAETINAEEALRLGLVDRVVPPDQLLPEVHRWIATMRASSPAAVRGFLELAALAGQASPAARDRELELFGDAWTSHDFRRSLAAFLAGGSSGLRSDAIQAAEESSGLGLSPRAGELAAARPRPIPAEISQQLEWTMTIYATCLRDYFSTFGTYTTATSILVAAIGFLARATSSPLLVLIVAICGLILCWQWYISTASMRDQVRHFKVRIRELEESAGVHLMSRWLLASDLARGSSRAAVVQGKERLQAEEDGRDLNWTFRFLRKPFGLRGTMLPVIYAAVFLGVGISFLPVPRAEWIAFAVALLWLLLLPIGIHRLHRRRRKKRLAG